MVESIVTYRLYESYRRTRNILFQIPDLAKRVIRLWALFQLPYCACRSFHSAPLRSTHRTPYTKLRFSLASYSNVPGTPRQKGFN